MNEMKIKQCPMCGRDYAEYPTISRTLDKEEICPDCGTKQALTAFSISTGPLYQTRAVAEWAKTSVKRIQFLQKCCLRHMHFDWGEMDKEDMHTNDIATISDDRIFSSYNIPAEIIGDIFDTKIWIITESDRSVTTILFPDDY